MPDISEPTPTTTPINGEAVGMDSQGVPTPDTPEYNEYMVAKASEADGIPQASQEEDLAGFESKEALVQAYKDLKAKSDEANIPQETYDDDLSINKAKGEEVDLSQINSREQASEYLSSRNVSLSDIEQEYYTQGGLSEASYKKLAEAGLPKFLVDNYIQGQQAIAGQMKAEVMGIVGGEDNYAEVIGWASKNLSEGEINAYNRIVQGSDLEATKMAVQGLHARYKATTGENGLVMGGASTNAGSVFESEVQMRDAMADPRYDRDPAYREAVIAKVLRSKNMRGDY